MATTILTDATILDPRVSISSINTIRKLKTFEQIIKCLESETWFIDSEPVQIRIQKFDAVFSKHCSNSHVAPDGEPTNWGGCRTDSDGNPLPTGYPGYMGVISFRIVKPSDSGTGSSITKILKTIGIKTGTGGGSWKSLTYDFKMFLQDWPGLSQMYTLNILKNQDERVKFKYFPVEKTFA